MNSKLYSEHLSTSLDRKMKKNSFTKRSLKQQISVHSNKIMEISFETDSIGKKAICEMMHYGSTKFLLT